MDFNPLTTTSLGAVILLMSGGMAILFKEIRRLNEARLRDMKEISTQDQKVIRGVTQALTSLRRKIDGLVGKHD